MSVEDGGFSTPNPNHTDSSDSITNISTTSVIPLSSLNLRSVFNGVNGWGMGNGLVGVMNNGSIGQDEFYSLNTLNLNYIGGNGPAAGISIHTDSSTPIPLNGSSVSSISTISLIVSSVDNKNSGASTGINSITPVAPSLSDISVLDNNESISNVGISTISLIVSSVDNNGSGASIGVSNTPPVALAPPLSDSPVPSMGMGTTLSPSPSVPNKLINSKTTLVKRK